ncbi:MAG: bifunctional diaminohydroxyphosphoribosylaminopyrimidine deaminase/5-amino-6-(5-phosphoribosylamino)uracil reductase RibD [Planctomycetota bacterium]
MDDLTWMNEALDLAKLGQGQVEPNPMVGCVLVRDRVNIGRGYHQQFGGDHAEVAAIKDCQARGDTPRGATAYVTLEPCCHHGKTPPCTNALITAGVNRVVVAIADPFAKVAGGGLEQLKQAGIEVCVGIGHEQAEDLIAPYLKRVQTGRPWVIAKWAMSIDGKIATASGASQWITNQFSRLASHHLRNRVDAIAAGMGTIVADDPRLTVRIPPESNADSSSDDPGAKRSSRTKARSHPVRLVFARRRVPDLKSQLVQTASDVPTWVIAGSQINAADLARLADHQVETWQASTDDAVEMVTEALTMLGGDENPSRIPMTNVMVEGGGVLLGSFASAGQIDEIHAFIGAKLIGGARAAGPVAGEGVSAVPDDGQWRLIESTAYADDTCLVYRRR